MSLSDFKIQRYHIRENWFLKQSIRILYTIDKLRNEFTRNETIQIAQILLQIGFEIEPERRNRKQLHEYHRLMRYLSETIHKRLYVNDVFCSIIMVHSDDAIFRFIRRAIHHVNVLRQIDKQTNCSVCYILFRDQIKNQMTELVSKNVRRHENSIKSNFNNVFANDESILDTIRLDLERFQIERQIESKEKSPALNNSGGSGGCSSSRANDDDNSGEKKTENSIVVDDTRNQLDQKQKQQQQPEDNRERILWNRKILIRKHLDEVRAQIKEQEKLSRKDFWKQNRNAYMRKKKENEQKNRKYAMMNQPSDVSGASASVKPSTSSIATTALVNFDVPVADCDDSSSSCILFNADGSKITSIDRECDFSDNDIESFQNSDKNDFGVREPFDLELFKPNRWPTFEPNTVERYVSRFSFVNLKKFYRMKKLRQAQQEIKAEMSAGAVAAMGMTTATATTATPAGTATITRPTKTLSRMSTGQSSFRSFTPLFKKPQLSSSSTSMAALSSSTAFTSSLDSVSQIDSLPTTGKRKYSADNSIGSRSMSPSEPPNSNNN